MRAFIADSRIIKFVVVIYGVARRVRWCGGGGWLIRFASWALVTWRQQPPSLSFSRKIFSHRWNRWSRKITFQKNLYMLQFQRSFFLFLFLMERRRERNENIVKNILRQFLTMRFLFFLDFEYKNWYKIEYKLNTIIVKLGTSENYIAL